MSIWSEDSDSDVSESLEAVETIQSALRGHLARHMAMKDLNNNIPAQNAPFSSGIYIRTYL